MGRTLEPVWCLKDAALDIGSERVGKVRSALASRLPSHERLTDLASTVNLTGLAAVRDESLEQMRSAVLARFPSAGERLTGLTTAVNRGTSVRDAAIDNVRYLGLGLLDRTEAMLEILLPRFQPDNGSDSDDSSSEEERSQRLLELLGQIPRPLVPEELRTFVVRVSPSTTLKFTVVCARDACVGLAERISSSDIRQILRRIHWAEAQRALREAAVVRSGGSVAIASVRVAQAAYVSCQRLLGERFALLAFGSLWKSDDLMSEEVEEQSDVNVTAQPTSEAEGLQAPVRPSNASAALPRETSGPQFRMVVKNSFLEVCEDDTEEERWMRKRRCRSLDLERRPFRIGIYEPYEMTLSCLGSTTSMGSRAPSCVDQRPETSSPSAPGTGCHATGAAAAEQMQRQRGSRRTRNNVSSSSSTSASGSCGSPDTRATVLIKNIPKTAVWVCFVRYLDELGFAGKYDFVYLPRDFTHGVGLGYALVAMTSVDNGDTLMQRLEGSSEWVDADSEGVLRTSWSEPQRTVSEHVDRYRNSPVMHESLPAEHKPVLFQDGKQVAFPPPTRPIRPPRIRQNKMPKHDPDAVEPQ
mmetsp:Transcript_40137/g.92234  ORF Transcript_40137/g.92234 Transcript_40137/m.92234 type:complete len:583 (-) Transcript_40137:102-1850(-)|eukprot:2085236-Amphidinium_carterae.1